MQVKQGVLLLLALLPVVSVAQEDEAPSLALLEYLGEWLDGEGNEIDPQALALLQLDAAQSGGERDDEK
jgi:hypothetical protein